MQEEGGSPGRRAGARSSLTGNGGLLPPRALGSPAKNLSPYVAAVRKDGDQQQPQAQQLHHQTSVVVHSEPSAELLKAEKPEAKVVEEIVGCLKMRSSMLAMGACERVKKIARVYPVETASSLIMEQLVAILRDGPTTQLAGGVLQALSIMALNPEGRQRVCLAGATVPLISFVRAAELSCANLDRAVTLLMNLAADATNRRIIREQGGVEALVELLRVAPMGDPVMEHALGAMHNLALVDPKAKSRAVEAGILAPLVRCVAAKGLPESDMCAVRSRLLLTELLKMPDAEERLAAVAEEMGVKI